MKNEIDGMDNTEQTDGLEAILAGLRTVDVPHGLEERVMLRVAAATAGAKARTRQRPRWFGFNTRPGWYGMGTAAALVLLGVMAMGRDAAMRKHPTGRSPATTMAASATVPVGRPDASLRVVANHPTLRRRTMAQHRPSVRLVSFPAPPAPLTEQERLLVQLVRKDAPAELARTDEVARAEGDAEFERFFKPPPPPKPTRQEAVAPVTPVPMPADTTVEITGTVSSRSVASGKSIRR